MAGKNFTPCLRRSRELARWISGCRRYRPLSRRWAERYRKRRILPTKKTTEFVKGYMFNTVDGSNIADRNETVCQIIGRVEEEGSLMENGPMFKVKFGDGHEDVALASELSPWWPAAT